MHLLQNHFEGADPAALKPHNEQLPKAHILVPEQLPTLKSQKECQVYFFHPLHG